MIDEESVGSVDSVGCGGKILRGDGALDSYLAKMRSREQLVNLLILSVFNWNFEKPLNNVYKLITSHIAWSVTVLHTVLPVSV